MLITDSPIAILLETSSYALEDGRISFRRLYFTTVYPCPWIAVCAPSFALAIKKAMLLILVIWRLVLRRALYISPFRCGMGYPHVSRFVHHLGNLCLRSLCVMRGCNLRDRKVEEQSKRKSTEVGRTHSVMAFSLLAFVASLNYTTVAQLSLQMMIVLYTL